MVYFMSTLLTCIKDQIMMPLAWNLQVAREILSEILESLSKFVKPKSLHLGDTRKWHNKFFETCISHTFKC